ncbi:AcrR family transcriptional regulator [Paraburkholderia sp. GAS41]|jgi:AcrR family transcriptional regulator|uniref:TetR/AcrR family transcriptional regulator n=1 Tax=Paraburkholderia sp. GAS41 TaxID=3035134 RepID=UPI003D209EF5
MKTADTSEKAMPEKAAVTHRRVIKSNTRDESLVQQRRDHLIKAAIAVFIEKGFHEATVRDIGKAANMTQGTIYNYVKSKDDILYLVCDRIVTEYQLKVKRAIDEVDDPAARIKAALRATTEIVHNHENEILLIYQNSHLLDKRSRKVILARVKEFIQMFEDIVTQASSQAKITVRNPRIAANIVTFLPTMIALRRWSLRERAKPAEVIEELSNFMARGLGF